MIYHGQFCQPQSPRFRGGEAESPEQIWCGAIAAVAAIPGGVRRWDYQSKGIFKDAAAVAAIPGGVRRNSLWAGIVSGNSRSRRDSGGGEAVEPLKISRTLEKPQSPRFRGG